MRLAHQWLRDGTLDYRGFVEGNDILSGTVDVVVTDGFTGNVALKTMEGLVEMTRSEIRRTVLNRVMAVAAYPLLRSLKARLDPRRYNGASLVGLRGIVIKSHGSADGLAFANAVRTAVVEATKGVPTQTSALMSEQPFVEQS